MKTHLSTIGGQPNVVKQNTITGAEVAQNSGSETVPKKQESLRRLPRSHADYWKPRLFRRHYSHKGQTHEVNDLYVRIQHGGRREFFPLHTTNRDSGAIKARDIFLTVKGAGWAAALSKFKPDTDTAPKVNLTVGEFLIAVEKTRRLRLRTFRCYRNCLRTVLAEAFGIKPKQGQNKFDYRTGGNRAWAERIDAIRLERLTPERVTKWKRNRIAGAKYSPNALVSTKRTVNAYIRCARSLFSPKIIRELRGVTLPSRLPFHGVELEEAGSMKYTSKIDVQELIGAARNELKKADPEAYKAFLLGFFAGMRKGEIDLVEWRMVDFDQGLIRLEQTEWLHLKTPDSADEIAIDPEVLAELQSFQPPPNKPKSRFVLHSSRSPRAESAHAYYRCEDSFKRLTQWLRSKGVQANKPLHELRKEVGAIIATNDGIFAASKFLRHSDITTTARHYADHKKRIRVGLGNLLKADNGAEDKPPICQ